MTTTKRKPAEATGQPPRTDGIGEDQIAHPEPPREAERGFKILIGVDPGITGAIAIISGRDIVVHDMPTAITGKTRKRSEILPGQLRIILDSYDPAECVCYVEQVSAMPGQGVSSMFGFGTSFGIILGLMAGMRIRTEMVTPQAWKRHHGLIGTDKDAARALASRLFPGASLARKKDTGRADALLIAAYGMHVHASRSTTAGETP